MRPVAETTFEDHIRWARDTPFEGWDFSALEGRYQWGAPPWSYAEVVQKRFGEGAGAALDLGTGGGEFLARLAPLPELTVAVEAWAPNIPVADRTLSKVGAFVVAYSAPPDNPEQDLGETEPHLPFRPNSFDVVISRHECYLPCEVKRVLQPGGTFITQQLWGDMTAAVRRLFHRPQPAGKPWGPEVAEAQVRAAGLEIDVIETSTATTRFLDIGALLYWLKAVPWELPDLDLDQDRDLLRELHHSGAPISLPTSHFLLIARAP